MKDVNCPHCNKILDKIHSNMYKAAIKPINIYRCYNCRKDFEIVRINQEDVIIKEQNLNKFI